MIDRTNASEFNNSTSQLSALDVVTGSRRQSASDTAAKRISSSHTFVSASVMVSSNSPAKLSVAELSVSGVPDIVDSASRISAATLRNQLLGCVGKELADVEQLLATAAESHFSEVQQLSHSATSMGGKRLRPMLVLLSAKLMGDEHSPRRLRDALSIAASVELVHAASLVHDDVMDSATHRRHQPTIAHQAGPSAAILLGDFLFTRGYAMAARCRSTVPARRIAAAATHLCEGELRQQASSGNWDLTKNQYRELLLKKTGALCSVSCSLGAWIGGGSRPVVKRLGRFGNNLGLAFQIFDDWLDYWGTEAVGKTLGTDLAQHKPTLPLIRFFASATGGQKSRMRSLLGLGTVQPAASVADPNAVVTLLAETDAAQYTLAKAQHCVDRARKSLSEFPDSATRDCLDAIAQYSIRRDA